MNERSDGPGGREHPPVDSPAAPRGEHSVVDALMESTLDLVARALKVDRSCVRLVEAGRGKPGSGGHPGASPGMAAAPRSPAAEGSEGCAALLDDRTASGRAPRPGHGHLGFSGTGRRMSGSVQVGPEVWGVLQVSGRLDGKPFDDDDLATFRLLVGHLGLCVENRLLHERVQTLANTDGLTELFNYRYFHERLDSETQRAERFGQPLSLLMMDVDGFKEFNDANGHPAGDAVLWQVARLLRSTVRAFDVVCRYGGDEFAAILPETSCPQALVVAARIESRVATHGFRLPAGARPIPITLSLGCSSYPEHGRGPRRLISLADRALYVAKGMPARPRISAAKQSDVGVS